MNKSTPGEWVYAHAVQNNGPNYIVVTQRGWGGRTICTMQADQEDDARLMVAAPDMFEALCELIVAYDMPNYGDPESTMDNMESVMPAVRAAVAKARGE